MGSDCRTADWNIEDADGAAKTALTMFAPALCPAMVRRELFVYSHTNCLTSS